MTENKQEENIVADLYEGYKDTQQDILEIEIRKTRNKLFTIAVVIFLFDFIALSIAHVPMGNIIGYILVVPVILTALGFLAYKEPLLSMILAVIIILGLWIYNIIISGSHAIITGAIGKIIIIYLLLAGIQTAKAAQQIIRDEKNK